MLNTTAQNSGHRSCARYGRISLKMPRASRNHRVHVGFVGLKSLPPSTRPCTTVQIVCMMMYGTTMSVIVRRIRFAVGVSADEK